MPLRRQAVLASWKLRRPDILLYIHLLQTSIGAAIFITTTTKTNQKEWRKSYTRIFVSFRLIPFRL